MQLVISTKVFDDIMREGKFEDSKKIISLFKAKGRLDFEKGKNYRRITFGGKVKIPCYVVKMDESVVEKDEQQQFKKGSVIPIESQEDEDDLSYFDF